MDHRAGNVAQNPAFHPHQVKKKKKRKKEKRGKEIGSFPRSSEHKREKSLFPAS
jgi:hypothetical protein